MNKTRNKKFWSILACPLCHRHITKRGTSLSCSNRHKYKINSSVPMMASLDDYLEIEAHAWEDEWQKGVSKNALKVYKQNMKVFKKLGFWEEAADAASEIPSGDSFTVLDLGCGNGVSTANMKGDLVVGMDLSDKQMVRAKKNFKNRYFVMGDARYLPFRANTFDLIVAINLLHHIQESDDVLNECYRVLKKGGKLLTVDPNLYNPVGYIGRGGFRLLRLNKIFPSFPQFALGEDERQFPKAEYYKMFTNSKFEKFKIIPHRLERLFFFATILIPPFSSFPGYNKFLYITSTLGNKLVKVKPFDNICYFWIGEATK